MNNKLFRESALQNLSKPEDLDQRLEIIKPQSWIALVAIALVLIAALVWGIWGSIPTTVQGEGVIIKTGGIKDVVTYGSGRLNTLNVQVGDHIDEGEIIGEVALPELEGNIRFQRQVVDEAEKELKAFERTGERKVSLQTDQLEREKSVLQGKVVLLNDRLDVIEERIENLTTLLDKGLVTKQTLVSAREEKLSAKQEIQQTENQILEISIKEMEIKNDYELRLLREKDHLEDEKLKLENLIERQKLSGRIVSPFTGRVVELKATPGNLLSAGTSVVSLESDDPDAVLEADVFVPIAQGKRIEKGMKVRLSPSTYPKEEFGMMIGKVVYVSEFPATREGMMRILNNEQLVQLLTGGSSSIAVRVELEKSEETRSGYKWTSVENTERSVQSGTIASGEVVVDTQRPIALVIPTLKKAMGL